MNGLRAAARKRNAALERAYASRLQVWRSLSTGEYYLVDIETDRAFGPVQAADVREQWSRARSCWTDEFLDVHWKFDELTHGALPGHARDWEPVSDHEMS